MSSDISVDRPSEVLDRTKTAESAFLPIPRETFEKLYLSPKHPSVSGDLRKKLANPTPICLMGFLIASTPNACMLMGWRGAGGNGGALVPVFIFFGGMVQILGAIGEWIIGNTFSSTLFFTYGTFWLAQGGSLLPFFATGMNYSPTGNSPEGQQTESYHATLGFYHVFMGLLSFMYMICAIRTNICLVSALVLLVITFSLTAGSSFQMANGSPELAAELQVAGGACIFAICSLVWYIFFTQILEAVDFPVALPVGDLSGVIPGRSRTARSTGAA